MGGGGTVEGYTRLQSPYDFINSPWTGGGGPHQTAAGRVEIEPCRLAPLIAIYREPTHNMIREPRAERLKPSSRRRSTDLLSFRRERPCRNRIVPPNRLPGSLAEAPCARRQFHDDGKVGAAARTFAGASKARQTNRTHQAPSTKK